MLYADELVIFSKSKNGLQDYFDSQPKYRVENGRNTDTAFMIGDAYLTLYPSSRVFFFLFFFISSMYTPEINREKTWEDLELIGTTIEKPGHWMSYHIIE